MSRQPARDSKNGQTAVLLDTYAVIWLANGDPLPPATVAAIVRAGLSEGVFVSSVSAWEVGMLSRPRSGKSPAMDFLPDAKTWFVKFLGGPGIKQAPCTSEIAIDAAYLPGTPHGDPADRLIIATARHLGIPIVTRDARISAYARDGHVRVIPC